MLRITPNLNDALFLHLHLFSKTKPKSPKSFPRLVFVIKSFNSRLKKKIAIPIHKLGDRFEGSLERGCLLYHHSCMGGWKRLEKKVKIVLIGFDPG